MIFFQKEGRVQNIKLLDFQLVANGSPVFDLSHCFYSGGSAENYNKLEQFLEIYYKSLSDTLNQFGLKAENLYSLNTLKEEWKKYCKFGFGMGLMMWRIKLADQNSIPNLMKDENKNTPFKIAADKEDEYKQALKELILHMYNNDFLEN